MLTVQHFRKCRRRCTRRQRREVLSESRRREICMPGSTMFRPEGSVSDAKGQTSAELVRTYNSQAHELVDAIAAAVLGAQAALNWLRADPPNLKEEVRQALDHIISAGQQAAEIVVRLRALIEKVRPPPTSFQPPSPMVDTTTTGWRSAS
jgi:hypothetical protein